VAPFSPRIAASLLEVILDLDDGKRPAAEIWRECGPIARRRRLHQPSYESVRRAVNAQRKPLPPRFTRLRRAAIIAKNLLFRTWTRGTCVRARAGISSDRRRTAFVTIRHERAGVCDESSQTRTRAAA
jgi:hypothetical protein